MIRLVEMEFDIRMDRPIITGSDSEFNHYISPGGYSIEIRGELDDLEAEYYEANLINNDVFDESTDEEFESILFGGK